MALRGGYSAMKSLPFIDFELIGRHPKIIAGFSDLSALLNPITERTGLVTLHAPMLINLDTPTAFTLKSLVNAVRFMLAGERYAPITFMTQPDEEPAHPLRDVLTNREHRALDGVCRGLSNKEIAREMDVHEVTVKLHVKAIMRKLNARNRTQAAMFAREAGLF